MPAKIEQYECFEGIFLMLENSERMGLRLGIKKSPAIAGWAL